MAAQHHDAEEEATSQDAFGVFRFVCKNRADLEDVHEAGESPVPDDAWIRTPEAQRKRSLCKSSPMFVDAGYVWGQALAALSPDARRKAMLAVQMIFQDPYASLNPRMRVEDIVGEAPMVHGMIPPGQHAAYIDAQLTRAGLDPAYKRRYPHQFSGGQRQRIGIARALAVQPEFLVCDEAVAALDVSIQAQILNLFMDLREQLDLTYLFISHDLGVVEHLSDRVIIMYLGRIVEEAPTEDLFARPNHPYTQALLSEIPRIDTRKRHFTAIKGEIPSPLNPPTGCHFHPRCPAAMARCREAAPALREIAPGHRSACHLNG